MKNKKNFIDFVAYRLEKRVFKYLPDWPVLYIILGFIMLFTPGPGIAFLLAGYVKFKKIWSKNGK